MSLSVPPRTVCCLVQVAKVVGRDTPLPSEEQISVEAVAEAAGTGLCNISRQMRGH